MSRRVTLAGVVARWRGWFAGIAVRSGLVAGAVVESRVMPVDLVVRES